MSMCEVFKSFLLKPDVKNMRCCAALTLLCLDHEMGRERYKRESEQKRNIYLEL